MFDKTAQKIPIVYSESYYVDIGEHVFPTLKYRLLKRRIVADDGLKGRYDLVEPEKLRYDDIMTVHTTEYIDKLRNGTLSREEIYTMEVPYSAELVSAAVACCGGTLRTAKMALEAGAAVHLGGGFHHAFPDHGEGFCILNDIAVSIRVLQKSGMVKKALVVDCDLHQGNGTAYIFLDDPSVFTFSIHQQNNYPFYKPKSDMDIGLKDYTGDKVYLENLRDNVPKIINSFKPEIILYLAGADPYREDQLGNLGLSKKGLRQRDNFICSQARNFGVPLAITLAGGYAVNHDDTVDIHFGTVDECIKVFTG